MTVGDWIQAVSVLFVAVALLSNVKQNREVARQTQELTQQTQELSRQNAVILASVEQSTYHALVSAPAGLRVSLLADNPKLLAWHLEAKGFQSDSYEQNIQRLYIMSKLETHELCFVSHREGRLSDDIWAGWFNVVKRDFTDASFKTSWGNAVQIRACGQASSGVGGPGCRLSRSVGCLTR